MIVIDPAIRVARGALPRRALANFARDVKQAIALEGDVSILLTTDAHIRELNRAYRRKDKATDVLSFPSALDGPAALAGDLAVSLETAERQAEEQGHGLFDEVRILLLHGMLHLKGFDHETDAGQMARKERMLRNVFALPQGLIQRAPAKPSAEKAHAQPRPGVARRAAR
jgi:probable rRNA maturation factor